MISKFKKELSSTQSSKRKSTTNEFDETSWLDHEFNVENDLIIAKDANLKTEDWYSIDDPRNSMNKKRRDYKSSHRSSHKSSDRSPSKSSHKSSSNRHGSY